MGVFNRPQLQNTPGVGNAESPSGPLVPVLAQKGLCGSPGERMELPHGAQPS